MCEVNRSNFEQLFPQIEEIIKSSDFIAIDTEFTGLSSSNSIKLSLFDDPETRYKKLKKSVNQFIICQFGLSAFVKDRTVSSDSKYVAHVFNFFIFPHSFGPIDSRFLVQVSSLEFLCQHKFDFNKFIYEGVPYLNKEQESVLRKHYQKQDLHVWIASEKLRQIDEQVVNLSCCKVEEWFTKAQDGDQISLDCYSSLAQYLVVAQLRKQFPRLLYKADDSFRIIVVKTKPGCETLQDVESLDPQPEEKILASVVGFSKVIQLLSTQKKPIIGHNVFRDLLLIYDKFYKALPGNYAEFKQEIHEFFPFIYDTKHIAFKIRKLEALKDYTDFLKETSLDELFGTLESEKSVCSLLYNPVIRYSEASKHYGISGRPHEAGYDAYQAGCVFIRMAHLLAYKSIRAQPEGPIPFQRYIKVLRPYENQVNISRADVNSMNLSGDDPASLRPQWLHVTALKRSVTLDANEVVQEFSRFGSLDVKVLDSRHAIIAVTSHYRAKDVLRAFSKSKRYRVRLYNSFLDSPRVQSTLWFGGLLVVASLWLGVTASLLRTKQ